jgi:hypothetical protein
MLAAMAARMRTSFAWALLGAGVLLPMPARAQNSDEDRAAARAAATSGIEAYEGGRFQEALDLCMRAEAILHAPVHVLYIARAQVKLGQLVKAHETYIKMLREQLAPDAPHAFVEAQAAAQREEAALGPRVPTLKVSIDGPREGVTVLLDGAPLSAALIGLQRPIDPGQHKVEAKSSGSHAEPIAIAIAESESRDVTLHVTPGAGPPEPAVGGPTRDTTTPPAAGGGSSLRTGGWISIGVGAAGVLVGTIFLFKNRSNRDDANALCPNGQCPASKRDQITSLDDSASTASTLAWVGYGVGVVGLGVGAVLLYMSGQQQSAPATAGAAARVVPWIGPRSAGATVTF